MNKLNCYGLIAVGDEIEALDLSYTDTSNEEGIIEYVKNVLKKDTFVLTFTILDFDHYKQFVNEVFEDYEVNYRLV